MRISLTYAANVVWSRCTPPRQ